MNFEPTKQEKLDMYEALLHDIAISVTNGDNEFKKLITNVRNWATAQDNINTEMDEGDQAALKNETFYNLRKL
jgi:hypothetical protein